MGNTNVGTCIKINIKICKNGLLKNTLEIRWGKHKFNFWDLDGYVYVNCTDNNTTIYSNKKCIIKIKS